MKVAKNRGSICVILNPSARGEAAESARQKLAKLSEKGGVKMTDSIGSGRRLATEAVREGYGVIIAAGGDGTVNEVVNGVGDVPDGFERIRFGVLPLGTINVFAQELGIPRRWDRAWEIIREGRERRIDLLSADYDQGGFRVRRYAVQLAGAGLDALATGSVDWKMKKRIGGLAYIVASLAAMMKPLPVISVRSGEGFSSNAHLVLVGNGRYYGGRFRVFPRAKLDDQLLDVCIFPKLTWWRLFSVGIKLVASWWPPKGVRYFQTESLELSPEQAGSPVPLEMDGEPVGDIPARFNIAPEALRVIVP